MQDQQGSAASGSTPFGPSGPSGRADDPIVLDDEDDELQAVLALSAREATSTHKRARSETPEEERRQIAEYVR